MTYIVFASAAVFVISLMDASGTFRSFLMFNPYLVLNGQIWRLVSWIFLPVGGQISFGAMGIGQLLFVGIALYVYYMIGSTLEREWGAGKFTIYYLFGMALHVVYGLAVFFIFGWAVEITPHYLNLSMIFALALLFPDQVFRLFLVLPIKVKWLALIIAAVFFVIPIFIELINGRIVTALLPAISLVNFFLICGDNFMSYLRPIKSRASPQAINFKKAAKKARRDQESKHYRHKCAVCGKTDTEFPGLEFRYCSRCDGYHCFCIDHINNHVHFK